ncbi:hypothetical protein EXW96_26655 [Paenibacillus sp. JMULE4]|uniref:hypothetical protein n=1 Tax=Paenibacillus sp. JMULE4 TaxID=2518342 RepID=UPI001577637F|nr:hypothetical protein [Paenibacillus sp. JMULE4]NTZ20972.1 hypothetical protein [Paenibacillus sp. JMULE4]
MYKKWFFICSLIAIIFFSVVAGSLTGATLLLGLVVGALLSATIVSTKSKFETNKRRNQKYALSEPISLEKILDLVNMNLKHKNFVGANIESGSVVVLTKKCKYRLTSSDLELTIYEELQPAKMVMYKFLFRPAPPIILANEARTIIPLIYDAINNSEVKTATAS